jgi:hypothetical protein
MLGDAWFARQMKGATRKPLRNRLFHYQLTLHSFVPEAAEMRTFKWECASFIGGDPPRRAWGAPIEMYENGRRLTGLGG